MLERHSSNARARAAKHPQRLLAWEILDQPDGGPEHVEAWLAVGEGAAEEREVLVVTLVGQLVLDPRRAAGFRGSGLVCHQQTLARHALQRVVDGARRRRGPLVRSPRLEVRADLIAMCPPPSA